MRIAHAVLRVVNKWRHPAFLSPIPTAAVLRPMRLDLPPLDPSDTLTLKRIEIAHREGYFEGHERAYHGVNVAWRNRWWWRRLYSHDGPKSLSRLQFVCLPLHNRWCKWRYRKVLASPVRS
jgi:hypothetical protein